MPDENVRQEVVTAKAIRGAYVLGSVGMVLTIVALLVLVTSRPQGRTEALDESQHQGMLQQAEERLRGFEVADDGAARLDIEHAMELVVQRGVDLALLEGGVMEAVVEDPIDAPEDIAPVALDGAPIFAAQCVGCHQATGAGIPGAFPPLANHVYELYEADRDYLPLVLLYGLQGPIEVNAQSYNGLMPRFAQLTDDQIAATLNYVLEAWGDADRIEDYEPYAATDIEPLRGRSLSAADVHDVRQEIGLP
ncbi:hypothetical protein BH23DEI1_BH23DEI1_12410 [soil metagenome]